MRRNLEFDRYHCETTIPAETGPDASRCGSVGVLGLGFPLGRREKSDFGEISAKIILKSRGRRGHRGFVNCAPGEVGSRSAETMKRSKLATPLTAVSFHVILRRFLPSQSKHKNCASFADSSGPGFAT